MISILKIKEDELLKMKSSENVAAELFNTISQIPASITDPGNWDIIHFNFTSEW